MKRLLLTGGAGFVGSHFLEHSLRNYPDWEILVLDRLSLKRGLYRIEHLREYPNWKYIFHDFRAPLDVVADDIGAVDVIVHMGAESHVDNSIANPGLFVQSNVIGTFNMLEFAREQAGLELYIQISTDEVYGPASEHYDFKEWDRLFPSNPYSATKAAGDCLALSHSVTYGLPVLVTRTMNVLGERQVNEKLIPKTMTKLLSGESMTVHGAPGNVGSRHWLHARNQADALWFLIERRNELSKPDIYNVVGDVEKTNLEMVEIIAKVMRVEPKIEYMDFHKSRPGHDRRYALDGSKLALAGWKAPIPFEESLEKTVQWYLGNPEWLGIKPLAA